MKKFSKLLALLLAVAMVFSVLAACAKDEAPATDEGNAVTPSAGTPEANDPVENEEPKDVYEIGESDVIETEVTGTYERKTAEGTLTIGTNSAMDTLNPLSTQSPAKSAIFDSLLRMNPVTYEIEPCLAESWEWSDDYLTCTIKIRDNANFSNGEPVTAEDVQYCFYTYANSGSMSASSYYAINFDKCEVVDEKTWVMALDYVYAKMDYVLAQAAIFPKAYHESVGEDAWWDQPIGAGPYTVVENVDGAYIKLAGREDYWAGAPECMDVTIKYFAESTAEFIAYESGEIDIAMNLMSADVERIQRGEVTDTTLIIGTAFDIKMLALCDYVECFQNENVRKAFAHAIDREACCKAAYGVLANVQTSNVNDSAAFFESQGIYEYDPELARELLAAEGYNDGDIVLRMICFNTNTDMLMAEAVQAYLAAVGVVVNIESYVMPVAIPMLREGQADITLTGTGGSAYEAGTLFEKITAEGTDKSTIIHDDELEGYIQMGANTMDPEIRAEAYSNAQRIMHEKCYAVPIANINSAYCYRPYIDQCDALTGSNLNPYFVSFAD